MLLLRKQRLSKKLDELAEDEKSIAESQIAVDCFDLEELMRDCVVLFDDLIRFDEHYRGIIFKNPDLYAKEIDQDVSRLFTQWSDVITRVLARFDRLEHEYRRGEFNVTHCDELRERFLQCSAFLNPSDCDSLLADEAIQQNREGRTVPM